MMKLNKIKFNIQSMICDVDDDDADEDDDVLLCFFFIQKFQIKPSSFDFDVGYIRGCSINKWMHKHKSSIASLRLCWRNRGMKEKMPRMLRIL